MDSKKVANYVLVRAASVIGLRPRVHDRPVFVVSMPRSGSSWIGSVIGGANGMIYLREPYTRSHITKVGGDTVFAVDPQHPPQTYADSDRLVQTMSPAFRPSVIGHPQQWPPFNAQPARLVVKEVNPLACGWFVAQHDPNLILILRHPAAIALSYRERGWFKPDDSSDPMRLWREFGRHVASTWRDMLEQTHDHDSCLLVRYEEICAEPLLVFERLCVACGIPFDQELVDLIRAYSSGRGEGAKPDPYGLVRDSNAAGERWRQKITAAELEALGDGFGSVPLPGVVSYDFEDANPRSLRRAG
jgi:hypothetical protein